MGNLVEFPGSGSLEIKSAGTSPANAAATTSAAEGLTDDFANRVMQAWATKLRDRRTPVMMAANAQIAPGAHPRVVEAQREGEAQRADALADETTAAIKMVIGKLALMPEFPAEANTEKKIEWMVAALDQVAA